MRFLLIETSLAFNCVTFSHDDVSVQHQPLYTIWKWK